MKRLFNLMLAVLLMVMLSACGKPDSSADKVSEQTEDAETTEQTEQEQSAASETKLDIDYIDMMLLHHPGAGDVEAYLAMEKAVADGKIRLLGLSNWYVEELEEFLPQINITPALVQNEIHPYYQENDVIPYIHSLGKGSRDFLHRGCIWIWQPGGTGNSRSLVDL